MYPEIKSTTESKNYAPFVDSLLSIGWDGPFHTSISDKRNDSQITDSWVVYGWTCSSYYSFYSEAQATFQWITQTGIYHGMLEIVFQWVL